MGDGVEVNPSETPHIERQTRRAFPSASTRTLAPAMSSRVLASASDASVITASARLSAGVRTARNTFSAAPSRLTGVVPGLDGPRALPDVLRRPAGLGVHRGLRVLPTEFCLRRLGAVDPEAVLGQVAAIGRDEADRARRCHQSFRHGGNGVGDVVVPRPPAKVNPPVTVSARRPSSGRPSSRAATCTADGKQEYTSTKSISSIPLPARSRARPPAIRIAGRAVEFGALGDQIGVVGIRSA